MTAIPIEDDHETRFPPFAVTPAAIDQIVALGGVRIDVEPGGCCGTTYVYAQLDPAPDQREGDERYGCPGAWLDVADAAGVVMSGATLDYAARQRPPRFRVLNNPNTEHTCRCRRSFGQPWPGPRQPTCRAYAPMPWDHDYEPPSPWQRQTGWTRRDEPGGDAAQRSE